MDLKRRNRGEQYWNNNGFPRTTTDIELNQIMAKKIAINGFYLTTHHQTKNYFDRLAAHTGGKSQYVNINSTDASSIMTEFIVERALRLIGGQANGDELVHIYREILKRKMNKN